MGDRPVTGRECARALWLLGLRAPVAEAELASAWRARIRQAHPDRHIDSEQRVEAATLLTRALNDARGVIAEWITSGRPWPSRDGTVTISLEAFEPEPWPERDPEPEPAPVCRYTGLRRGDRVRVWPYDGELEIVAGTDRDPDREQVWVNLLGTGSARADRVRLAAYGCPICGMCAGPRQEWVTIRPCPACLVDLRRLDQRPAEASRIRSAIEARAHAGRTLASELEHPWLMDRADDRSRWARGLRHASAEDLTAALLSAFSRAYERWSEQDVPVSGQTD